MFKRLLMDCWIFMMLQRFPLYNDTYTADTNQAGLNGLTKLPVTSLAVGLTYFVAEKVGTDVGGDERFVMRSRTISATGDVGRLMEQALDDIRAGRAYTTNGGFTLGAPEGLQAGQSLPEGEQVYVAKDDLGAEKAEKVQGHFLSAEDLRANPELAKKGYSVGSYYAIPLGNPGSSSKEINVDGTGITTTKTTNQQGVQNDDVAAGDKNRGVIADNTTNEIQAEQIAHTIYQTTEPFPRMAGSESADRRDGDKTPTETKTTTPAGVQNDDPTNKGTDQNQYSNIPKGGSEGEGTGAERRQDEAAGPLRDNAQK